MRGVSGIMLLAIHLIVMGLFVLLGIIFSFGKGAGLIAGYNTASQSEKEKYREKELCKGMGKLMFSLAACWLVVSCSEIFGNLIFLWIGLAMFPVVIAVGLIYINTAKRFKK